MLQDKMIILLLLLVPVFVVFVAGIVFLLITKADRKALERKLSIARTEKNDNIKHIMESMQVSISRLRETTDKIKIQTEQMKCMGQKLRERSGVWNKTEQSSLSTRNNLGGKVSFVRPETPAEDRPDNPLPPELFPPR